MKSANFAWKDLFLAWI